jgi:ribosomal protein S18 acetylase RimI-like enzyme
VRKSELRTEPGAEALREPGSSPRSPSWDGAASDPGSGPGDAPIRQATTAADIAHARALFEAYAAQLHVDLCFQGFAEELATLPGAYAPPRGCLLLAGPEDAPIGCVALRPAELADRPAGSVGEVKRLYVVPEARGAGLSERLMRRLMEFARATGYRELVLDTLPSMTAARRLYARLGFVETSPYYRNPLPGVVYLTCRL